MKREIKFRAWDGHEITYDVMVGKFGAFYVNPSNSGIDENDSASLSTSNTLYPKSVPIMQYTGLKDKNNIEIYEGDIIKQGKYIEFVEYSNETFELSHGGGAVGGGFEFGDCWDLSEMEVIGNIYSNPELL